MADAAAWVLHAAQVALGLSQSREATPRVALYGARALNAYIPDPWQFATEDVDVLVQGAPPRAGGGGVQWQPVLQLVATLAQTLHAALHAALPGCPHRAAVTHSVLRYMADGAPLCTIALQWPGGAGASSAGAALHSTRLLDLKGVPDLLATPGQKDTPPKAAPEGLPALCGTEPEAAPLAPCHGLVQAPLPQLVEELLRHTTPRVPAGAATDSCKGSVDASPRLSDGALHAVHQANGVVRFDLPMEGEKGAPLRGSGGPALTGWTPTALAQCTLEACAAAVRGRACLPRVPVLPLQTLLAQLRGTLMGQHAGYVSGDNRAAVHKAGVRWRRLGWLLSMGAVTPAPFAGTPQQYTGGAAGGCPPLLRRDTLPSSRGAVLHSAEDPDPAPEAAPSRDVDSRAVRTLTATAARAGAALDALTASLHSRLDGLSRRLTAVDGSLAQARTAVQAGRRTAAARDAAQTRAHAQADVVALRAATASCTSRSEAACRAAAAAVAHTAARIDAEAAAQHAAQHAALKAMDARVRRAAGGVRGARAALREERNLRGAIAAASLERVQEEARQHTQQAARELALSSAVTAINTNRTQTLVEAVTRGEDAVRQALARAVARIEACLDSAQRQGAVTRAILDECSSMNPVMVLGAGLPARAAVCMTALADADVLPWKDVARTAAATEGGWAAVAQDGHLAMYHAAHTGATMCAALMAAAQQHTKAAPTAGGRPNPPAATAAAAAASGGGLSVRQQLLRIGGRAVDSAPLDTDASAPRGGAGHGGIMDPAPMPRAYAEDVQCTLWGAHLALWATDASLQAMRAGRAPRGGTADASRPAPPPSLLLQPPSPLAPRSGALPLHPAVREGSTTTDPAHRLAHTAVHNWVTGLLGMVGAAYHASTQAMGPHLDSLLNEQATVSTGLTEARLAIVAAAGALQDVARAAHVCEQPVDITHVLPRAGKGGGGHGKPGVGAGRGERLKKPRSSTKAGTRRRGTPGAHKST